MICAKSAFSAPRIEGGRPVGRILAAAALAVALAGCEEKNTFVAPPPPKVDVATPVQRPVTRYVEATGNTAPVKSVDLVARVQALPLLLYGGLAGLVEHMLDGEDAHEIGGIPTPVHAAQAPGAQGGAQLRKAERA